MGKAWLIASGKGGTGKSTVTAALASCLGNAEGRVCILDADIGLRDQDMLLGLENQVVYDLLDVCTGKCQLDRALIRHPQMENLYLLPAAQFARAKDVKAKAFRAMLHSLKNRFAHVLIDCPAGMQKGLRTLLCDEIDAIIVVCTPDDVCIRNAEHIIQLMADKDMPRPELIVNRLVPQLIREHVMYTAAMTAQVLDVSLLGEVPQDMNVTRCLGEHVPLMTVKCPASDAIERIAGRMSGKEVPLPGIGVPKPNLFKRMFHRA